MDMGRLGIATEDDVELAERVVGIGLVRCDETVAGEVLLGLGEPALQHRDVAELVVGEHPVRTDLEQPAVEPLAGLVVAQREGPIAAASTM